MGDDFKSDEGELTQRRNRITLTLRLISQLFRTVDPSPFHQNDLAQEAEEYLIEKALYLPRSVPIEIVVQLPPEEFSPSCEAALAVAIRSHFERRAQAASREIKELFKTGRLSLLIALVVLSFCLLLAWHLAKLDGGPVPQILQESFVILGWVAIWKPFDIFLYGWPPMARRRKLLRRISEAIITVDVARPGG